MEDTKNKFLLKERLRGPAHHLINELSVSRQLVHGKELSLGVRSVRCRASEFKDVTPLEAKQLTCLFVKEKLDDVGYVMLGADDAADI